MFRKTKDSTKSPKTILTAHVLEFFGSYCEPSHIEVILENKNNITGNKTFYRMDRWTSPEVQFDEKTYMELINSANQKISFQIDKNMNDIINEWQQFFYQKEGNILNNNCADATAWFLNKYCDIPNPGKCGLPITCNYTLFGIFAPSFSQCVTLPGRVMDYAEHKLSKDQKYAEMKKLN